MKFPVGKLSRWSLLAAMAAAGAGCGGLHASKSISPLDFLLPGAGHFLQNTPPAPAPPGTNNLLAAREPAAIVALAR